MKTNVFLALLITFDLGAAMTVTKQEPYMALMHQSACAASEEEAIRKVDIDLKEKTGVDSKYLFSENIYIRHATNSRGEFCVEGVLTQKGLSLFDAELAEEYEGIMGRIEDLDEGITFAQKETELKVVAAAVDAYNNKIALAEKIAPVVSKRIDESMADLSKMINAVPTVDFKVEGGSAYVTASHLLFVASVDDDSPDAHYHWEFGDGVSSSEKTPLHAYSSAGDYTVSLTVTDSGNKSAEVRKKVRVTAKPKPIVKPAARFEIVKKFFSTGESVRFDNYSSSSVPTLLSYDWDFGDGSGSNLPDPEHSYKKAGLYRVRLEVKNEQGMTDSVESSLRIVDPAILFATKGLQFDHVVQKFGKPEESVVNAGASTQAYQYGGDWILVKYNKVECRIKGEGFKTNLMGNAKGCSWYEKNRKTALYDIGL